MSDPDLPDPELPEEEDAAAQPPEDPTFPKTCQWTNQRDALAHFASYEGATQSQQHIKPLHWYVACRLVIEGGFRPEEITPRPPFTFKKSKGKWHLTYTGVLTAKGSKFWQANWEAHIDFLEPYVEGNLHTTALVENTVS